MKIATLSLRYGDLKCQNIGSNVDSSKVSYEIREELPREESSRTYKFTSTFYSGRKITIEIKILKKCEEKEGFRILNWQGKQQEQVSRKECESRDYWNRKYPNENLIVSFVHNLCNFDFIKDIAFIVRDVKTKIFVHSSSCQQIRGKEENNKMVNRIHHKQTDQQNSSKTEGNLSLVVYIYTGGGFLVLVAIIGIVIKKRKPKERGLTIVDTNTIYGRNDPEEYYEDGKNTQIEDKNVYYGE